MECVEHGLCFGSYSACSKYSGRLWFTCPWELGSLFIHVKTWLIRWNCCISVSSPSFKRPFLKRPLSFNVCCSVSDNLSLLLPDQSLCGRMPGRGRSVLQCVEALARWAAWSLLFPPPDDDHSGGVGRCQQTLVAVEADVEHWAAVALQLVHDGLGVALHVKEVHTGVLAARHWLKEMLCRHAGVKV